MAKTVSNRFDDIRPYRDSEIPAAMQRIAEDPLLSEVTRVVFPEMPFEEFRRVILSAKNIFEFQEKVMYPIISKITDNTIREFTVSGLENISSDKRAHLFVCNHRDIVMDSMLLQKVLFENSIPTSLITFGSNLMSSPFVIDIGKSNKMFKVERKGPNIREFLANSAHLSDYIRNAVTTENESVWIAQRNGRTKDGNDATDQGLVKMFSMSGSKDLPTSFAELNITPVTVSYRFEPCDVFKAREMYLTRDGQKYVKSPGEDLNSIITGILQPKGSVRLTVSAPIVQNELEAISESGGDFFKLLAELVDERIYSGYRLYDTNYIAHDMRSGNDTYSRLYTPEQRAEFEAYTDKALGKIEGDRKVIKEIFLGIYANSVDNTGA